MPVQHDVDAWLGAGTTIPVNFVLVVQQRIVSEAKTIHNLQVLDTYFHDDKLQHTTQCVNLTQRRYTFEVILHLQQIITFFPHEGIRPAQVRTPVVQRLCFHATLKITTRSKWRSLPRQHSPSQLGGTGIPRPARSWVKSSLVHLVRPSAPDTCTQIWRGAYFFLS